MDEEEVYNLLPEEEYVDPTQPMADEEENKEDDDAGTQDAKEYSRSLSSKSHDSDFMPSDVEADEPAERVIVIKAERVFGVYVVTAMKKDSEVETFTTKNGLVPGTVVFVDRIDGVISDWSHPVVLSKAAKESFKALVKATGEARSEAEESHERFKVARNRLAERKLELEQALQRLL
jgi:hypothetical protein